MIKLPPVVLALCLTFPSLAYAETYETYFNDTGSGESRLLSVGFNGECGDECHAAGLSCDANSTQFYVASVGSKQASLVVTEKVRREIVVKVDRDKYEFSITRIEYEGEMTGDWSVHGNLNNADRSFEKALTTAKNFKATVGANTVTLPVTEDVIKWAKACGT